MKTLFKLFSVAVVMSTTALSACGGSGGGYSQASYDQHGPAMGQPVNGPMNGPNGQMMGPNGEMMGPNGENQNGPQQQKSSWFGGNRDENTNQRSSWFGSDRDNQNYQRTSSEDNYNNFNQPSNERTSWFGGSRDQNYQRTSSEDNDYNSNEPSNQRTSWFGGHDRNQYNDDQNQPMNYQNDQRSGFYNSSNNDQNTQMRDQEIIARVRNALQNNRNLNIRAIQVTSDDGTITLRGAVATSAQKDNAESTAKTVPGVKSVSNKLSVQQDQNQMQTQ